MTDKEQAALYAVILSSVGTSISIAADAPPLLAAGFLTVATGCFGYVTRETIRIGLEWFRPERKVEE